MTDNINLWLHLVAFSALYFDNIVWIFCLIVGWQVLQVRPRKATPGVRRIPETHFQLGRNPQQRRRRPAVQQRFHLLLQGWQVLEVQRQKISGRISNYLYNFPPSRLRMSGMKFTKNLMVNLSDFCNFSRDF